MLFCDDFSSVEAEFEGIALPDARFEKNVKKMAGRIAAQPGASFSAACGEALRKSAHRLFSYGDLDLLATHRARTAARISAHDTVLLVEDTTDLVYRQKNKKGMGPLGGRADGKTKGLNLHSAMAHCTGGTPLGIVSHRLFAPSDQHKGKRREKIPIEQKESYKWIVTTNIINDLAEQHPQTRFVKVADREADLFEHYSQPRQPNAELLVRLSQKKRIVLHQGKELKVGDLISILPVAGQSTLTIKRKGKAIARTVCYRYATIELPPTAHRKLDNQQLRVVIITSTDDHQEALEWLLITTLPVDSLEDCVRMGQYYALRWTIERYHFILKSGMGVERTQLHCMRTIGYALELWAVVGWWVLLLYRLGRLRADEPAAAFFESEIIEVLQITTTKPIKTVADVVKAVGELGGFRRTKKQPMPGEKTLWIGIRLLEAQLKTYRAAKQKYGTG